MIRIDEIHDKKKYEMECLDGIRHVLQAPNNRAWMERAGLNAREVKLDGAFPDTKIVLTIHDDRPGRRPERLVQYALWKGASNLGQSKGLQPEPGLMASNIFHWMMES